MKKLFFLSVFLLLISVQTNSVFAGFISNSISVKRSENTSYWNNITVNWDWDLFNLRVNLITDPSEANNDFKIIMNGLPTNLTASWYVIESDTCTTNIKNIVQQDNTIHYTYTPNWWVPCNAILTANYITSNTLDGVYNIAYTIQDLSDDSLRTSNNSAILNVNNLLRIVKSESIDADVDGFIDKYQLTFNKDIWTNSLTVGNIIISDNNSTASGLFFMKTSSTTWDLSFTDWVFSTWDTPDINITTTHNTYEQNIYNLWVIEDTASPYVSTINSTVYNGSNITIATIPSNLVIDFTESVRENDISWITIQVNAWNVTGTTSLNTDKDILTFTPTSAFIQWDYTISFNSKVIDLAWNVMNLASAWVTLWTPPSGWGGSGWSGWSWWSSGWWWSGGGWVETGSFETEKSLSKIVTKISKLKDENNLIGTLLLDMGNIITNNSQVLTLKVTKSSISEVQIWNNMSIQNYTQTSDNIFYPAMQLDESKIITWWSLMIEWNEVSTKEIAGIYEFNPQLSTSELSENIKLQLVLKKKSTIYPVYVYHLSDLDNGWEKLNSELYIMDKENSSITFSTNKFGYYLILQNRYVDENPIKVRHLLGNTDTINTPNSYGITFLTLDEKLKNALELSAIEKLADKFLVQLTPTNYQYFLSFDWELRKEYDNYAVAFYNSFVNLENFVKTKDSNVKKVILTNLPTVIKGIKANRDLELKYVNKNNVSGNIVYSPKNELINRATSNLQNKILTKLNNLIISKSISLEEYNRAMNAYNYFILHLDIFIEYKSEVAKKKVLEQVRIFIPTYNKKIIIKTVETVTENPTVPENNIPETSTETPSNNNEEITSPDVTTKTYWDTYFFDFELRYWSFNTDITHMQKILLELGYFDYATTWYYWDVTAAALSNFAMDKYNMDIDGKLFNQDLINKLLSQPVK